MKYLTLLVVLVGLLSCTSTPRTKEKKQTPITPVKVTHIQQQLVSDNILLNAISVFRKKNIVTANLSGYIQDEMIVPGQEVSRGQLLFIIETKEAKALGGQVVDSSLHFKGIIKIRASKSGYISQLNHQKGDYVMEGTPLCTIADQKSFVFLLQVPFELTPYIKVGKPCEIILPDGQHLVGKIDARNPTVNATTQTQEFVLRIRNNTNLPDNLIAQVKITKSSDHQAKVLPKSALLTNVQEDQWWVMKMVNDSVAIKVLVKKGITTDSLVQIVSPKFSPKDRILISGNYGLPDTATVKIVK